MLDNMGQRTNRKRTRHRPGRAQRKYTSTAFAPSPATMTTTISPFPPQLPSQASPSLQLSFPQYPQKQNHQQQSFHHPSAMSIRYSYISPLSRSINNLTIPPTNSTHSYSGSMMGSKTDENALTRDLRVFGGVVEDEFDCADSSTDLRGPMLDVVLGLFNGVDYDDESC